jgi:RNA polymerase sigma-70 factor (ECF subfamily)
MVSASTWETVADASTFSAMDTLVTDPDAQLMLRVKKGDQSAFKILVEKYQKPVTNVAYHLLLDRAAAEELAQEVFLKVFQTASRYRAAAKFSTWVYRIATNLALNELKSRKRAQTVPLDDVRQIHTQPDNMSASLPGPQEQMQQKELVALLERALQSLPVRQRTAVMLHRFEELSYREIAESMDCTVEAVEALLSRAKITLRDVLKGCGYPGTE